MSFSREEIRKALFDMAPFKAPRSDGFHARFYQNSWDVMGNTVCNSVIKFFQTGQLLESMNNTLLILIPKVKHPELIS